MQTENLSTLVIHKLSQAQYERERAKGTIDESAYYLTPDDDIDLSLYETTIAAEAKLAEAKAYADTAADIVKSDLLNGAGDAYDTLKELGDLIDDNTDAIDALNTVAAGKANRQHKHTVEDLTDYQLDAELDKTSANPVRNSAVAAALETQDQKIDGLDGKITAGALIDQNSGTPLKLWHGTAAEYKAMETQPDGVIYILDDEENEDGYAASEVTYDNDENDLAATNVQDAIDDVYEAVCEAQARADAAYTLAGNSTGSLADLGITATAAELNYCSGASGNLQEQIDNHTHAYLPLAGGTITATTASTSTSTGALVVKGGVGVAGDIYAGQVFGAVYNDYAEYRAAGGAIEAGRVVVEAGDDTLRMSDERLLAGGNIVTDTYGFAIGQTELCSLPVAVSGRVLAYPYEPRDSFQAGDAVCTGPNGTVSKMTREEICEYPERIVGTVSCVPSYETWGEERVPVNGRIWVKIK